MTYTDLILFHEKLFEYSIGPTLWVKEYRSFMHYLCDENGDRIAGALY